MKKWLILISVLSFCVLMGFVYMTVPKHIDENFKGYVFSKEHKLIKEVPVKLKGNRYNTFGNEMKFEGVIEIDGNSKKIKSTGSIFTEIDNSKYFFASNFANSNNSEGVNEVSTCVIISKDFKILFGFTPGLVSKYGERSYFKTNKDLETFLDK